MSEELQVLKTREDLIKVVSLVELLAENIGQLIRVIEKQQKEIDELKKSK